MKRQKMAAVLTAVLAALFLSGGTKAMAADEVKTTAGSGTEAETADDAEAGSADGEKRTAADGTEAESADQAGSGAAGTEDAAQAEEPPSIEGQWVGDGEDWQYLLPDGSYLRREWLYDGGDWYHFSGSGYMQTGMQKISSDYYYFLENGAMITGWFFDEDEEAWYHAKEDGALTRGWLKAGDAWYWFDSKGAMYDEGFRMVSGHRYYFFENGQLAASQYVGLDYYDENGLRDRSHDIIIEGDRRPAEEEEAAITEAMAGIPRAWIRRFIEDGWELMYYTERSYFSAPRTEQGIYYLYYDTDTHYRKLKFCSPSALAQAFGEFAASEEETDWKQAGVLADYAQYLQESGLVQALPAYFDEEEEMQFGSLFAAFCREDVRADMKELSPHLYQYMTRFSMRESDGQRPEEADMIRMNDEATYDSDGFGPASDESLLTPPSGPSRG